MIKKHRLKESNLWKPRWPSISKEPFVKTERPDHQRLVLEWHKIEEIKRMQAVVSALTLSWAHAHRALPTLPTLLMEIISRLQFIKSEGTKRQLTYYKYITEILIFICRFSHKFSFVQGIKLKTSFLVTYLMST